MATLRPVHIVALTIAVASSACSVDLRGNEVSTREEKRFTVSTSEQVELKLRTFDGALTVRSWDKNEVFVVMAALNGLDALGAKAAPVADAVKALPSKGKVPHERYAPYVPRLLQDLQASLK